jgi:hypothetical protein
MFVPHQSAPMSRIDEDEIVIAGRPALGSGKRWRSGQLLPAAPTNREFVLLSNFAIGSGIVSGSAGQSRQVPTRRAVNATLQCNSEL